ncbi:DUF4351 domain-containing protein [Herbivorax sp. ANBcel31]|uniref:DUF4351 domain-containing protein n=1 Tax=Herbivorax sp. ANBcel31 TaxID=3069754 RepID=UPI0027B6C4E7|nr:DUF4351 domain-containing protein [Herbivorax sp. ANBcel31]MDQ2087075.1 DUF4351 domain-containing protein [Herbivorax sp. ANBcel31]
MIIPLVVYNGSDEWKIKTTLGEMIKGYGDLPEDVNDIVENIEKTYPEGSEVVMTLAEQLREEGKLKGIEEGKQEGLEEGQTKALSKSAIRLLTKKFGKLSEETKSKIEKLDSITLEIIIDQIFEYKTLDDAKKYFD